MNVLVLSDLWQPFPGGAERLMFNVARDLDRRSEFDVRVLTGYAEAQQFDGPPVAAEPIGVFDYHAQGAAIIGRYLTGPDFPPDAIVTHHLYAYEFETELAATGIPVVQFVLNTRRLDSAAFAVFISDYVANEVGICPGDLLMIPPAFDDVIATTEVAPFDREAVGFIKPVKHKGVELVYEVAAAMPDTRFVVLRGEWQTLEILTDLPNVEYVEPVDDIATFYDRCRVVLMPSISEDAGTVAQECAVNGIPCVSSLVGGLAQTNAGGIQIARRDLAYWVDALRFLEDPGLYAIVAKQQRKAYAATHRDEAMDRLAKRIAALVDTATPVV